ncbi:MAG: RnfABCDGE type electron transport complex subunit E [Spirochaetes bacterium]|jgi:electron transport complex protein RnfE|nr:RnfABCDGE type electron transport complex subunit E [Spirochaetota bacterium]
MSSSPSIVTHFAKGFVRDNPVFVQVLGMCPTLAVTTSVVNGVGMGLATTFVVVSAATIASFINRVVPSQVRIPVYAVIIATFVTIADLALKAFFPPLSEALGPYVPLIVVNCMIMGRIEAFATRNAVGPSIVDALGMGAGFTAALMVLGGVREILGSGELFGASLFGPGYTPMLIMILPAGAFIALGLLMAIFNHLRSGGTLILRKAA